MRKIALILLVASQLEAARGGGGFGGGRGGDFRGGGFDDFHGGPTMSRVDPVRDDSQFRNETRTDRDQFRNDTRPDRDQFRNETRTDRSQLRNDVRPDQAQFRNEANTEADQMRNDVRNQFSNQNFSINKTNYNQSIDNQRTTINAGAAAVQRGVAAAHPGYGGWFGNQFYNNHGLNPYFNSPGADLWRAATWGDLNGWLGWGDAVPVYYNEDGTAITVPANSNQNSTNPSGTNSNTTSTTTSFMYRNNGSLIALADQTTPTATTNNDQGSNWTSLGVFAVGQDPSTASFSNMFIQLNIDKQGNIAGTYYNSTADKAYQLAGTVNKQTQQAAWKLSNTVGSPVMYTGLFNLTENATPVQVMFSDLSVQTWYLVRLQK